MKQADLMQHFVGNAKNFRAKWRKSTVVLRVIFGGLDTVFDPDHLAWGGVRGEVHLLHTDFWARFHRFKKTSIWILHLS